MIKQCPFCQRDISEEDYEACCSYCKNYIGAFTPDSMPADKDKIDVIQKAYQMLFSDILDYSSTEATRKSLEEIINKKYSTAEAKKYLNKAAQWALTLLQTGVVLTADSADAATDTNFKEYANSIRNFYNDDKLEILERFGDGIGLTTRMRNMVEKIRTSVYGTAVRAESLIAGCTDFKNEILRRSCIDAVKEFLSEYDKDEVIIFISAPSRNFSQGDGNSESIEYRVAKKLKEQLEYMGVKAFWWETFNSPDSPYVWDQRKDDLNISAKIAFGLAVSSIFISLAFIEENYVQSKNCMYELNKFFEYLDKDIMPFIINGEMSDDKIIIRQTGKKNVCVSSTDPYFYELTNVIKEFREKLPQGRKQYCRVLNAGGLKLLRTNEIDLYNLVCDNNDQSLVKCKPRKSYKTMETAIEEYTSMALKNICSLLYSSYSTKYNKVKRKFHFSDREEFETWFCDPNKEIAIQVEDEVVEYAKRNRTLKLCEVRNTPSNYHMSYAIIDNEGHLANDEFLIFMENRGYNDDQFSLNIALNLVINETNRHYSEVAEIGELAQILVGNHDERQGDFYCRTKKFHKIKILYNDNAQDPIDGDLRYYTNQGGKLAFASKRKVIDSVCQNGCKIVLYNSEESKCEFNLFMFAEYEEGDWGKKIDKARFFNKNFRYLRCPYCGHVLQYINTKKMKDQGVNYGKEIITSVIKEDTYTTTYSHYINSEGVLVCRSVHTKKISDGSEENITTKERKLPNDFLNDNSLNKDNRSAVILMLGLSESGKSVFISKLFDVRHTNDEAEIGEERIKKTGISFNGKEIEVNFAQPKMEYLKAALSRYFQISYPDHADNRDLREYCSIPYYRFMSKTMSSALDPNYLPSMLLNLQRKNSKSIDTLSLIDIPGEALEDAISILDKDDNAADRYIQQRDRIFNIFHNCDAMIFMLDLDSQSNISSLVKLMREINKKSNVALAIAVCKFDKYEEDARKDYASINSFIPNEDSAFYAGSDRDKYINFASDKIQEFIKEYCIKHYGDASYNELADAIKYVPFHKFFAVSAIGNKESIFEDERLKGGNAYRCSTRFIATPRGIDNVILWLTYQLGIID